LLGPTVMEGIKSKSQYTMRSDSTFVSISTTILQKSPITITRNVSGLLY